MTVMQGPVFLTLSAFGALLALHSPAQAQTAESPVALDHIRAALQQPPSRLQVTAPSTDTPTFRVEVRQQLIVFRPRDDEKPFDPTFGLPSVGELLMGGIEKVRTTAVNYERGRAQRRAHKKVDEDLAAFCATNACPTPPASHP
jgi:hypothetical protein